MVAVLTAGELLRPFRAGPEEIVTKIASLQGGTESAETKKLISDFLELLPPPGSKAPFDKRLIEGVTELFRTNPSAAWALLESMELQTRLAFANKLCVVGGGKVRLAVEILERGWVNSKSPPALLAQWLLNASVEDPAGYRKWTQQIMKTLPPAEVLKTLPVLPVGSGKESAAYLGMMMDFADKAGHKFDLKNQLSVAAVCEEMGAEDFKNNPQFLQGIFAGNSFGLGLVKAAVARLPADMIKENLHLVTDKSKFDYLVSRLSLEQMSTLDKDKVPEGARANLDTAVMHRQFDVSIGKGDTGTLIDAVKKLNALPHDGYVGWLGAKIVSEAANPAGMLAEIGKVAPAMKEQLTAKAMTFWAKQDVVSASAYLAEHPEMGDQGVIGLLPQIADDPESAVTWAMKIQEPKTRNTWLESYLPSLRAVNPAKADEISRQISTP